MATAQSAQGGRRSWQGLWRDHPVMSLVEANHWLWWFDSDPRAWWYGDYEGFVGWWWWGSWGERTGWWFVDPVTGRWRFWDDMNRTPWWVWAALWAVLVCVLARAVCTSWAYWPWGWP